MYNRKIKDLRAFLTETLYNYEYEKINLSENEFANRLKMTCYFINEKIISTIEYYQYNAAPITEIEKAKDKCKDLSILLDKYKTDLTKLGINPNEQLSFKKEVNDAFDFELTENTKELLPNYLEIKKEFLDCIHIETSTETTKPIDKNIMFQLGIRLAIGDLDDYYTVNKNKETSIKHGYSAPKISKELGNPEWNKFILATLNYYQKGQSKTKNIWINRKTMRQVYKDCKDEKIKMTDFFIEKYNELLQD